jgi:hypothetical protein
MRRIESGAMARASQPYRRTSNHALATLFLALALVGCSPKATDIAKPSRALGIVLAEEAIRAAGARKSIAIISPDKNWGLVSTVEEEFRANLEKHGVAVATTKMVDPGDPMRSGPIGLKAADFVEVIERFPDVGTIVSFAGAPCLSPGQEPKPGHPPVLVIATAMMGTTPGIPGNRSQLGRLLEARVIQIAIIDVSEPQAIGKADATHELFAQHYRILRAPE